MKENSLSLIEKLQALEDETRGLIRNKLETCGKIRVMFKNQFTCENTRDRAEVVGIEIEHDGNIRILIFNEDILCGREDLSTIIFNESYNIENGGWTVRDLIRTYNELLIELEKSN